MAAAASRAKWQLYPVLNVGLVLSTLFQLDLLPYFSLFIHCPARHFLWPSHTERTQGRAPSGRTRYHTLLRLASPVITLVVAGLIAFIIGTGFTVALPMYCEQLPGELDLVCAVGLGLPSLALAFAVLLSWLHVMSSSAGEPDVPPDRTPVIVPASMTQLQANIPAQGTRVQAKPVKTKEAVVKTEAALNDLPQALPVNKEGKPVAAASKKAAASPPATPATGVPVVEVVAMSASPDSTGNRSKHAQHPKQVLNITLSNEQLPTLWRWCPRCEIAKSPYTHHCRVSDRCVPDMDHYCPFVNRAIGRENYVYFIRFLFWASLATAWVGLHAINILIDMAADPRRATLPAFPGLINTEMRLVALSLVPLPRDLQRAMLTGGLAQQLGVLGHGDSPAVPTTFLGTLFSQVFTHRTETQIRLWEVIWNQLMIPQHLVLMLLALVSLMVCCFVTFLLLSQLVNMAHATLGLGPGVDIPQASGPKPLVQDGYTIRPSSQASLFPELPRSAQDPDLHPYLTLSDLLRRTGSLKKVWGLVWLRLAQTFEPLPRSPLHWLLPRRLGPEYHAPRQLCSPPQP